jgi:hypothetical protein
MKKTVLTFGIISGVMSTIMMVGTIPFVDRIGFDKGQLIGYTAIVLSFLMVFFGIRSYRDNAGGGTITFGRGFVVGLLITLISCAFYVVTWEILYFNLLPDFADKYAAYAVEKARTSGSTQAEIDALILQMKNLKAMLDNPLINAAMTLLEPLPVGLLISLISAAILRRQKVPAETLPAGAITE